MSKKQKQKQKPYHIFELTIVRAWLIFGMLFAHILSFINICYSSGVWPDTRIPRWIGRICSWTAVEDSNFMLTMWLVNSSLMFFTQGLTLSFSRHNGKRAFSMFMVFFISVILTGVEEFIRVVFDITLYRDVGLVLLSFSIFGVYALCIILFKYIVKLRFNFQFIIFIVLLIPGLLSLYYFNSPRLSPLQWFNINLSVRFYVFFNTAVMFPYITFFSLGTLVGQIYYKNKISPFATEKYLDFMRKSPVTRFILWSGDNTGKIFMWHWWFFPLFFFLLTLFIMNGLPLQSSVLINKLTGF